MAHKAQSKHPPTKFHGKSHKVWQTAATHTDTHTRVLGCTAHGKQHACPLHNLSPQKQEAMLSGALGHRTSQSLQHGVSACIRPSQRRRRLRMECIPANATQQASRDRRAWAPLSTALSTERRDLTHRTWPAAEEPRRLTHTVPVRDTIAHRCRHACVQLPAAPCVLLGPTNVSTGPPWHPAKQKNRRDCPLILPTCKLDLQAPVAIADAPVAPPHRPAGTIAANWARIA